MLFAYDFNISYSGFISVAYCFAVLSHLVLFYRKLLLYVILAEMPMSVR